MCVQTNDAILHIRTTDIFWMHHATSFFKVSVLRADVFWMRPVRTIRSRHPEKEHPGSIDYATIFYFDLHSWESSKAPEVQVTWTDTMSCCCKWCWTGSCSWFCWLLLFVLARNHWKPRGRSPEYHGSIMVYICRSREVWSGATAGDWQVAGYWGSSSKSVGALHHCSGAAGFSCGNDLWSLGTIVKVKLWFGTSGTNTSPHEALLTLSILIRTCQSRLQARLRLWQLFFRSGMNMAIPLPVTVSIFGTFAARNLIISFQMLPAQQTSWPT